MERCNCDKTAKDWKSVRKMQGQKQEEKLKVEKKTVKGRWKGKAGSEMERYNCNKTTKRWKSVRKMQGQKHEL